MDASVIPVARQPRRGHRSSSGFQVRYIGSATIRAPSRSRRLVVARRRPRQTPRRWWTRSWCASIARTQPRRPWRGRTRSRCRPSRLPRCSRSRDSSAELHEAAQIDTLTIEVDKRWSRRRRAARDVVRPVATAIRGQNSNVHRGQRLSSRRRCIIGFKDRSSTDTQWALLPGGTSIRNPSNNLRPATGAAGGRGRLWRRWRRCRRRWTWRPRRRRLSLIPRVRQRLATIWKLTTRAGERPRRVCLRSRLKNRRPGPLPFKSPFIPRSFYLGPDAQWPRCATGRFRRGQCR